MRKIRTCSRLSIRESAVVLCALHDAISLRKLSVDISCAADERLAIENLKLLNAYRAISARIRGKKVKVRR